MSGFKWPRIDDVAVIVVQYQDVLHAFARHGGEAATEVHGYLSVEVFKLDQMGAHAAYACLQDAWERGLQFIVV